MATRKQLGRLLSDSIDRGTQQRSKFQQLLTLCKDSRRFFRSDAEDSLSIPSPISRCGIRHIHPFPR
jgi:hypothetical protein